MRSPLAYIGGKFYMRKEIVSILIYYGIIIVEL
ncbi:MAG: hypothetical protein KatS3mg068_1559 [Candidatus Sericytochromatia bacterium]|nr:MAG: hypothetical protein KatS3mg068_1559 [Candidatus Sericytochromatia bacterium]